MSPTFLPRGPIDTIIDPGNGLAQRRKIDVKPIIEPMMTQHISWIITTDEKITTLTKGAEVVTYVPQVHVKSDFI